MRHNIKRRLEARYPGVRVVSYNLTPMEHRGGELRQCIRFRATRQVLIAAGLVTESMFEGDWSRTNEYGNSCTLYEFHSFSASPTPNECTGQWELMLCAWANSSDGERDVRPGVSVVETKKLQKMVANMLEQAFAGRMGKSS